MALKISPGASAFHTSPKPPAPMRSRSVYPGIGSAWGSMRTAMCGRPRRQVEGKWTVRWKPSTEFRPRLKKCRSHSWGKTGVFAPGRSDRQRR